jgi:hypothetical protein
MKIQTNAVMKRSGAREIIYILWKNPTLTFGEIHEKRETGTNIGSVKRIIKTLEKLDIVVADRTGEFSTFTIDLEHWAIKNFIEDMKLCLEREGKEDWNVSYKTYDKKERRIVDGSPRK